MPQVIILTQCRWCGKVKTKDGVFVDIGLPIFYIELKTSTMEFVSQRIEYIEHSKFPIMRFDLVECPDCEPKNNS